MRSSMLAQQHFRCFFYGELYHSAPCDNYASGKKRTQSRVRATKRGSQRRLMTDDVNKIKTRRASCTSSGLFPRTITRPATPCPSLENATLMSAVFIPERRQFRRAGICSARVSSDQYIFPIPKPETRLYVYVRV